MFGVNPTPGSQNPMASTVTLKSRILQVRGVVRGDTVGYGGGFTASRDCRIAVVAAGYADGYARAAGVGKTTAYAIIAGRHCPLVGRISMDLMAFDVSALPGDMVQRGDFATLIGEGITVDDVGVFGGSIGYEVLTNLGRRFRREWIA
jgi:alanine racemase